ncbi:response regulator [Thermodesulfobacteriota bacterium]
MPLEYNPFFGKGEMAVDHVSETIRNDCAGQPQILLMEDESSVAQGLQMVLREEGYDVDLAMTGQSALNTLSHKGFDLLVADLQLSDMDGMEVIKRVRDERPETEVIVITGYANVPSAVEALKTGVLDYLPKPFTGEEFVAAVEGALKDKNEFPIEEHIQPIEIEQEKLIRKREVIHALKKAYEDDDTLRGGLAHVRERSSTGDKIENHITLREEEWMDTDDELTKEFNVQKNLIENAIDGIMAWDRDGKVIVFNKRLEKILGYSQDEAVGKMLFDQFFPIGAVEQFKKDLYNEKHGSENTLFLPETDLIHKAGNKIAVQLSATVLFEEGEQIGIAAFFRDLKEFRKLEQEFADLAQLLHQDKIMSLGRLAASIVHEINNPLTGILNYIRLMIKVLSRNDSLTPQKIEKFQRYLTLVESETSRCSSIVSNLLAFSRKSEMQFREVNIGELLEKCVMLSQHKLDLENLQVKTYLDSKIPEVWGNFNQIQQCIINLIFNAIDAMTKGGMLTLRCTYNKEEGVVEVQVEDDGCGIAKEKLSNIFDPFFTTKKDKGLGLGLSTVYRIIDQHKGTISVDSELGKGTIFSIKLPALKIQ